MRHLGYLVGFIGLVLISLTIVQVGVGKTASPKPQCDSCSIDARTTSGECLEFVQVELGQRVEFVKPNGDRFDGVWEADFGTILEDGTYIAPRNTEAPGIDRVTFSGSMSPSAPGFSILIQLIESENVADEDSPTLNIVHDLGDTPYTLDGGGLGSGVGGGTGGTTGSVGAEVEEAEEEMLSPTSTSSMSTVTIGGPIAYVVPAIHRGTPVTVSMLARYAANGQKSQKCGVFPPPVNSGCTTGSLKKVEGRKKFEYKSWKHKAKQFQVNASITNVVGLSVGTTVTIDYDVREVICYQYTDIYTCIGGQWVYDCTEICRWYGLDYKNFDPPYGVWFVFPTTGQASISFQGPNCQVFRE